MTNWTPSFERLDLGMILTNRKFLRFAIAIIITFALIALAFVEDFPVAMLAAILVPLWINISGIGNRLPRTFLFTLLALGGLFFLAGVLIFLIVAR